MKRNALIIFAREPKLGKVKTRLAKDVGDREALRLYKSFVRHTLKMVKEVKDMDCYIFYAGSNASMPFLRKYARQFTLKKQQGSDLGERMYRAFKYVEGCGYENALIIGTDCLEINAKDIDRAIKMLGKNDYVLGPSMDGGYYLLGSKRTQRSIFQGIAWGESEVLSKTVQKMEKMGKSYRFLPRKRDIDHLSDWLNYLKKNRL